MMITSSKIIWSLRVSMYPCWRIILCLGAKAAVLWRRIWLCLWMRLCLGMGSLLLLSLKSWCPGIASILLKDLLNLNKLSILLEKICKGYKNYQKRKKLESKCLVNYCMAEYYGVIGSTKIAYSGKITTDAMGTGRSILCGKICFKVK